MCIQIEYLRLETKATSKDLGVSKEWIELDDAHQRMRGVSVKETARVKKEEVK